MDSDKNNVDFSFRSYDEKHDTDLSVNINGENVDNKKLCKLLNTYLKAIGSTVVATYE
jgi:hypothetical protein